MTAQNDIVGDENYKPILDHGFIGIAYEEINGNLVPAVLGNDKSIARGARMSYGKGTKSINDDTNLIRYLLRHKHTSPFELTQVKFHIKAPIFVMRQMGRHRTASSNEYSGRYSEMTDEFYIPTNDQIQPQSQNNKQGREGKISDTNKQGIKWVFETSYQHAYDAYKTLLGEEVKDFYDLYDSNYQILEDDFKNVGISRELARTVLPVGNYTELYWQANLHNIFNFIKLRADDHAQYEIRVYAEAIYELLQPYFPIALKAFDDYVKNSVNLSAMEYELVKEMFNKTRWENYFPSETYEDIEREKLGMSKREWKEFKNKFDLDK